MTSLLEVVEEEGEIYPCDFPHHHQSDLVNRRRRHHHDHTNSTHSAESEVSKDAGSSSTNELESCVDEDVDTDGERRKKAKPISRRRILEKEDEERGNKLNGVFGDGVDDGYEDDDEVIDRLSSVGSECSFISSASTSNSNSSSSSSGVPSTHKCLDCLRYACEECAPVHSEVRRAIFFFTHLNFTESGSNF